MAGGLWWINRELRRVDYCPDVHVLRAQLQASIGRTYEGNKAAVEQVRDEKERQTALRETEHTSTTRRPGKARTCLALIFCKIFQKTSQGPGFSIA